MEERINVAEILRNCPKGMELDCTIFGTKVIYQKIYKTAPYPIVVQTEHGFEFRLTQYGQIHNIVGAECVIFPVGKTTWEGFQRRFEDGDVVATHDSCWIGITTGGLRNEFVPTYCIIDRKNEFHAYLGSKESWCFDRLATEEEKEKLFKAIKDKGYKWNEETKTLEKVIIPKFKVGDRVKSIFNNTQYKITELTDTYYTLEEVTNKFLYRQPIYEVVNWELVPDKFDITNLKPFDKVLVRCGGAASWEPQFFSKYEPNIRLPFKCTYNNWAECIPYEANKHLCDTTNDCDEYYKTWE
jgi:hypothetical protein